MTLAKITVESGDKSLQIARADITMQPVKQLGPLIDVPPQTTMTFVVNSVQGLVIRENPL